MIDGLPKSQLLQFVVCDRVASSCSSSVLDTLFSEAEDDPTDHIRQQYLDGEISEAELEERMEEELR